MSEFQGWADAIATREQLDEVQRQLVEAMDKPAMIMPITQSHHRTLSVVVRGRTAEEMEAKAVFRAAECFGKAYEFVVSPAYVVHELTPSSADTSGDQFEAEISVEARPIAVDSGVCSCDKHTDHAGCYEVCPCWTDDEA